MLEKVALVWIYLCRFSFFLCKSSFHLYLLLFCHHPYIYGSYDWSFISDRHVAEE